MKKFLKLTMFVAIVAGLLAVYMPTTYAGECFEFPPVAVDYNAEVKSGVHVRSVACMEGSTVVVTLSAGEIVHVKEDDDGWKHIVTSEGTSGWVWGDFLMETSKPFGAEPELLEEVVESDPLYDVDGHKYEEAIQYMYDNGIVNGYPDGSYQPERVLNRAELLKIVVEAVYTDEFEDWVGQKCFPDINEFEWYAKYVCFAKAAGIVQGHPDGTFKPEDQINLVEATKIALKTFNYEYDEDTDPWYYGLITKAAEYNYIPVDFTSFEQKMNRGQMADHITRILKRHDGVLDEYLGELKDTVIDYSTLEDLSSPDPDPIPDPDPEPATDFGDDTPVVIYTERISEESSESRTYPTVKVYQKVGAEEPEVLIDSIGGVGEYPIGFVVSPDEKYLLINLESKLMIYDFSTQEVETLLTPNYQVNNFIFVDDGAAILVWDQVYASTENDTFGLHKVQLATKTVETLYSGGDAGESNYFIAAERQDNKVVLWEALGEASASWYFDLATEELVESPIGAGIFQYTSNTGEYLVHPKADEDWIPEICPEFLSERPGVYTITDAVTGDPVLNLGDSEMVTEIVKFSPDDSDLLFARYEWPDAWPDCSLTPEPVKTYYTLTIDTLEVEIIEDHLALLDEWDPQGKKHRFESDYETMSLLFNDLVFMSFDDLDVRDYFVQ